MHSCAGNQGIAKSTRNSSHTPIRTCNRVATVGRMAQAAAGVDLISSARWLPAFLRDQASCSTRLPPAIPPLPSSLHNGHASRLHRINLHSAVLCWPRRAEVTCARAHSPQCIFPQPHGCAPVIHLHSPHLPSFRSLAVLLSLPDVSDASTTTTDRSTCQSQSTSCCASILESTTACTCTSTELLLLLSCHPISHSSSH
jgi:hypothetical protein